MYLHSGSNVTQPEALKTRVLYKPKGSGVLYHQSETLHGHWTSAQTTASDTAIENPLAPRVLGFTCKVFLESNSSEFTKTFFHYVLVHGIQ